jgi:hypothetical protein
MNTTFGVTTLQASDNKHEQNNDSAHECPMAASMKKQRRWRAIAQECPITASEKSMKEYSAEQKLTRKDNNNVQWERATK